MSIFVERLISLRKANELSQKALAAKINVSENTIQRYEYGTRKPTIDILIALADCFNVSIDYLAGRSNTPGN